MLSILITGTSKGIGFETALAFGRADHTVYATMRNPSRSPQLAKTAVQEKLPITRKAKQPQQTNRGAPHPQDVAAADASHADRIFS